MTSPEPQAPQEASPPEELPYVDPIAFTSGVLLTDESFHLVSGFRCSREGCEETEWEQDVSQWLLANGRQGAREAIRLGLAEVRLFQHQDGRLIGYAAIGDTSWVISSAEVPVCLLHYFGVNTPFRGQKSVAKRARYGPRILGGVLEYVDSVARHDFLALYVDPRNGGAIDLYKAFGFADIDVETEGDRTWLRMARPVKPIALTKPPA